MSAKQNPFGHRSVRCKKHGVAYNPDLHSGCPLCRRGQGDVAHSRPPSSIDKTFVFVVSVSVMVIMILIMVAGQKAHNQEVREAALQVPTAPENRPLDPTPYRSEITAVEAVVYQNRVADLEDEERLRQAMLALEEALGEGQGGERASVRLRTLSERALSTGYVLELGSVRKEWEDLRTVVFVNASWFHRSTPQLAEAQTIVLLDTEEMIADRLEGILIDLDLMIREEELQALQMAAYGPVLQGTTLEAEEAEEDPVQQWSRSWRSRLDDVLADRPATPDPEKQPRLSEVSKLIRTAETQLRLIPVDAARGTKNEVERRFDLARTAISSAQVQLLQGEGKEVLVESTSA